MQKKHVKETEPTESYKLNPLEDLFKSDPMEIAKEIESNEANSEEVPEPKKKRKVAGFKTKKLQKVRKTKKLKKVV